MSNSNAALQRPEQKLEEARQNAMASSAPKPRLVPSRVRTDRTRSFAYSLDNENEMNQSDPLYSPFFAL